MYTSLWQTIYQYTTTNAAIRFLPVGITSAIAAPIFSVLVGKFPAKLIALSSLTFMFVATILLPFADQKTRYWSLVFPAFIIGSAATMGLYIVTRSVLFHLSVVQARPKVVGVTVWLSSKPHLRK
jgi:MFS family permease